MTFISSRAHGARQLFNTVTGTENACATVFRGLFQLPIITSIFDDPFDAETMAVSFTFPRPSRSLSSHSSASWRDIPDRGLLFATSLLLQRSIGLPARIFVRTRVARSYFRLPGLMRPVSWRVWMGAEALSLLASKTGACRAIWASLSSSAGKLSLAGRAGQAWAVWLLRQPDFIYVHGSWLYSLNFLQSAGIVSPSEVITASFTVAPRPGRSLSRSQVCPWSQMNRTSSRHFQKMTNHAFLHVCLKQTHCDELLVPVACQLSSAVISHL